MATETTVKTTSFYLWQRILQKQWYTRFRNWLEVFSKMLKESCSAENSCHTYKDQENESSAYLNILELLCLVPQFQLPSEILKLVSAGEIPYYEMDGQYMFKRTEIDGWLGMNAIGNPTSINPQILFYNETN